MIDDPKDFGINMCEGKPLSLWPFKWQRVKCLGPYGWVFNVPFTTSDATTHQLQEVHFPPFIGIIKPKENLPSAFALNDNPLNDRNTSGLACPTAFCPTFRVITRAKMFGLRFGVLLFVL